MSGDSDREELYAIDEFKKGYDPPIEREMLLSQSALKILSGSLSQEEKRALIGRADDIDRVLLEIQSKSRHLQSSLNQASLQREANLDFHNIFSEPVDNHRISFIAFQRTYCYLLKYANEVEELWTTVRKMVGSLRIKTDSKLRTELVNQCVNPGAHLCEIIRTFCGRMARLLHFVGTNHSDARTIGQLSQYHNGIEYTLSTIFTSDLTAMTQRLFAGTPPRTAPREADFTSIDTEEKKGSDRVVTAVRKTEEEPSRLDASGSMPWNRNRHYFFSYDPIALAQERASFSDVVHIDTHMGADRQQLRTSLVLNVSKKLSKLANLDVEREYTAFLRAFFEMIIDLTLLNFKVPPLRRLLFLYHLGPSTFYTLARRFMHEFDTGSLHKTTHGKMIQKYVPSELAKKITIDYWRIVVLAGIGSERDDYPVYNAIVRNVKDTYRILSERAVAKYDTLPEPIRAKKSRTELFRENMNEWVGMPNLIVCRRFLKET